MKTTQLHLHAQTGLHPGSGTATGAIDLPVQRERHTSWPLIPGSTLKGVLRDHCRRQINRDDGQNLAWADRDPELECIFGPSVKGKDGTGDEARGSNASDFAGALAVTDASILLFPVRSLCGLFAWVTCPAALQRYQRDARLSGAPCDLPENLDALTANVARVTPGSPLLVPNPPDASNLVLEEFDFQATEDDALKALGEALSNTLEIPRLATHLAVLADDQFTHFVNHATQVEARIALDYETKTVSGGALFYVETLPPETVFHALLIADPPRNKRSNISDEAAVLKHLADCLKPADTTPPILQIGGEASTGKGLCRAILANGGKQQ